MIDAPAFSVEGGSEAGPPKRMLPASEILTIRSIVLGLVIGTVTTMQNIYFALKYGFTVSNNISAAILGFGALKPTARFFKKEFTSEENCVLMTVAVAATAMVWGGSMPFAILAMSKELRDEVSFGDEDTDTWEPTILKLMVYSAALCFIGFCLAIPLREKFVVKEPLPFPYALAAAKTIESLNTTDDPTYEEPMFLLKAIVPAWAWGMFVWSFDGLERMPLFGLRAKQKFQWQLNLSIGPFGHGFIVPARYILSELIGASVASGVLIPLAVRKANVWYDKGASGFEGQQAFYLLPAIFAIAADSVYQLLKIMIIYLGPPLVAALRRGLSNGGGDLTAPLISPGAAAETSSSSVITSEEPESEESKDDFGAEAAAPRKNTKKKKASAAVAFGRRGHQQQQKKRTTEEEIIDQVTQPWFLGWLASSLIAIVAFRLLFNVRYDMAAVALLSSPLWSIGITLAVGTTGSNVASSAGKVMIMLFAAWYGSPGHVVQTLALGALSIAIIDQALDLVRDFKTAYLLHTSPRAMFIAQSIGAGFSIFTSSILYYVYTNNVSLPSASLPAVIAESYRGLAFTFAAGFDTLPKHCLVISLVVGAVAVAFNLVHDLVLPPRLKNYCPSGVAFGVGIILLPGQILIEVVGLAIHALWQRYDPESCAKRDQQLGAAFLAGDGLAGVLQAVLDVAGVTPPRSCSWTGWYH